jgi:MFS family permease
VKKALDPNRGKYIFLPKIIFLMSQTKNFKIIVAFIAIGVLTRLIPHMPNITALGAICLFGAAYFKKKYWAFLIPLAAIYMSDLFLNNVTYASGHEGFVWFSSISLAVYAGFAVVIFLGSWLLRKVSLRNVFLTSIIAGLVFYLITNFGSWLWDPQYPKDLSGLTASYIAGLPFLRLTIIGNLVYSAVFFGIYEYYFLGNKSFFTKLASVS